MRATGRLLETGARHAAGRLRWHGRATSPTGRVQRRPGALIAQAGARGRTDEAALAKLASPPTILGLGPDAPVQRGAVSACARRGQLRQAEGRSCNDNSCASMVLIQRKEIPETRAASPRRPGCARLAGAARLSAGPYKRSAPGGAGCSQASATAAGGGRASRARARHLRG